MNGAVCMISILQSLLCYILAGHSGPKLILNGHYMHDIDPTIIIMAHDTQGPEVQCSTNKEDVCIQKFACVQKIVVYKMNVQLTSLHVHCWSIAVPCGECACVNHLK